MLTLRTLRRLQSVVASTLLVGRVYAYRSIAAYETPRPDSAATTRASS